MYQDGDKDKIVNHILSVDTHISPKCEHNTFIDTLSIFLSYKECLMYRDSDIKIPHSVHTFLIKHNICRKTDEPKIWTLNTVLMHKRFLHYDFLKGRKSLMCKQVALIFWPHLHVVTVHTAGRNTRDEDKLKYNSF